MKRGASKTIFQKVYLKGAKNEQQENWIKLTFRNFTRVY